MATAFMIGNNSAEQLKSFIERAERVLQEIKQNREGLRDIFSEAKGTGFDIKTIKEIIKIRNKDPDDLIEDEYILNTYKRALGMLPLFDDNENDDTKVTLNFGGDPAQIL